MSDVRNIFETMGARFQRDKCEKAMVYYFSNGDEKWTVHVSPEEARAEEGKTVDNADCIIKADPQLFVDMVTKGKMPKPWHFGSKIKTNSPALLMKMGQMFGLGK